jgi:hypothetical protein
MSKGDWNKLKKQPSPSWSSGLELREITGGQEESEECQLHLLMRIQQTEVYFP